MEWNAAGPTVVANTSAPAFSCHRDAGVGASVRERVSRECRREPTLYSAFRMDPDANSMD